MTRDPIGDVLDWLEDRSPALAAVVFHGVVLPAMFLAAVVFYVAVLVAQLLAAIAAVVVVVVAIAFVGRRLDIIPPPDPPIAASHTSH